MPGITRGVTPQLNGRRPRGLSGPATARAAGNSVVTSDLRGGGHPATYPGDNNGGNTQSSTYLARETGLKTITTPGQFNPAMENTAYGGGWGDGRLTVRERFVAAFTGTSKQGRAQSQSGIPNPQYDGPPMPQYLMDNRTESWQIGTDHTGAEDNPAPHGAVAVMGTGRPFPLGTQDGSYTEIMGPPLSSYRDYGARGISGMHGPAPAVFALAGDGSGAPVGTMIDPGEPAGQLALKFRAGDPHGLHSPTAAPLKWTMARQASIPQQKQPRVDRPNDSKIAGQSMAQTFISEAASGTAAAFRHPVAPATRRAGNAERFLPRKGGGHA